MEVLYRRRKDITVPLISTVVDFLVAKRHIKPILRGLAAEALKHPTFELFEKAYILEIKHGQYWHVTADPSFFIGPLKGPRDMSSLAHGKMSAGKLMITSDLEYWVDYYGDSRKHVAEIDMVDVPAGCYKQVNRGFGNEFWVEDPGAVRVIQVLPIQKALARNARHSKIKPDSKEELKCFYNHVHDSAEQYFDGEKVFA